MSLLTYTIIPSPDTGTYSLANGYAKVTITGTGPTVVEYWRSGRIGSTIITDSGSWTKTEYLQLGFGTWTVAAVDNSVPPVSLPEYVVLVKPLTGHITGMTAGPSTNPTYPANQEWIFVTVTGTGPVQIQYIKGWLRGINKVSDTGTWTLTDWLKIGYGTYTMEVTDGTNTFDYLVNNPSPVCVPVWTCTFPLNGTQTNSCDGSTRASQDPACIPAGQTYDCLNGVCVSISGGRYFEATCGNACSNPPPTTHKECQDGICISVPGAGTDTCSIPGETCPTGGEGKLNINTYPVPGARIFVNNIDSLSITPTELSLQPGNKFIRLVTPGYADIIDNVEIVAGQTTTKIYVLTPVAGTSGDNTGLILLAAGALGLLLIGLMSKKDTKKK